MWNRQVVVDREGGYQFREPALKLPMRGRTLEARAYNSLDHHRQISDTLLLS